MLDDAICLRNLSSVIMSRNKSLKIIERSDSRLQKFIINNNNGHELNYHRSPQKLVAERSICLSVSENIYDDETEQYNPKFASDQTQYEVQQIANNSAR